MVFNRIVFLRRRKKQLKLQARTMTFQWLNKTRRLKLVQSQPGTKTKEELFCQSIAQINVLVIGQKTYSTNEESEPEWTQRNTNTLRWQPRQKNCRIVSYHLLWVWKLTWAYWWAQKAGKISAAAIQLQIKSFSMSTDQGIFKIFDNFDI